jgi:integrase
MSSPDKLPYKLISPHKITLYKNGDNPNIYYYFTFKHKSYRGSTGKDDLKSSIEEVFDIFYEVKTGKRKNLSRGSSKFENLCKQYLKHKEVDKKKILSPRTLSEYKRNSKFLLEKFRGREIETLCSEKVYEEYQEWRRKYYETHETKRQMTFKRNGKVLKGRILNNVGSVPINRELRLLVSILRYSKNSLGLLSDVIIPPYKMLDENSGKKILKDTEFEKLRDYMSVNRPFQCLIVSFINSTGTRYPSEIGKILWSDIDWEIPCVWIRNRKNPKRGNPVDTPVPLVGMGLEVIKTLWSRNNIPKGQDDPVFVNDKGKQVKSIRKSFKYCLEKCGLDTSVCLYSFRHRFTTRILLQNTIPMVVLSKILGHKSTEMVMKHYESLDKYHFVKIFQDSMEVYYEKKEEQQTKQDLKKENKDIEQPSYVNLYQQSET